jgi:hypothetical protein
MMSLSLYSEDINESVEISRGLYRELTESEFSKIGTSKPIKLTVDGEQFELQLVALTPDVRLMLVVFLARQIAKKSTATWRKIRDESMTDDGFEDAFIEVESLIELLKLVSDNKYDYIAKF